MFKECVSTKYREKKLKLGVWQFVLQKEKKRVCDKQKEKERDKSTSKRQKEREKEMEERKKEVCSKKNKYKDLQRNAVLKKKRGHKFFYEFFYTHDLSFIKRNR